MCSFRFVCVYVFIHVRTQPNERRECGTTPELEHVRNGWWARLSSRRTSRFYGTMVLRAHLVPIHHPLTFTGYSCKTRQRKGTRTTSDVPLVNVSLGIVHRVHRRRARGSHSKLRAFLRGEHLPRVSDQPKRVSGDVAAGRGFRSL